MQGILDVRLADGSAVDVVLQGDRVAAVAAGAAARSSLTDGQLLDGRGGLLLPAFVDTHVHLDKVGIRPELDEHARYQGSRHPGDLPWAIAATRQAKRAYTVEGVRRRARAVIERHVLHGATHLRSHVDVDSTAGLVPLQGVQAAARDCADIAEVRTIAFPQEGILRDPGAADLMVAAMEAGADVVGGMPHWEQDEAGQRDHVRFVFDLAARFDADLDLHVDETDDGDVRTLAMVVEETERRGWQGRVTVGHVCSLAAADQAYADAVIAACARAGVCVVANPVTNLVLQGRDDRGLVRRGTTRVRELLAAGVPVAFGQDCVDDAFYPFGRGDMLEVALLSAHAAHLTTVDELDVVLAAVTDVPARAWHLGPGYGVRAGARADLQLYAAPTWPEALRAQDPPVAVWHGGRLAARTTVLRELRRRAHPRAADAEPGSPGPAHGSGHGTKVTEMRLVVTADDYAAALAFFRDALGLPVKADYDSVDGRATLLDAGRATLEIFDREQAEYIDRVEVGSRVAGHLRVGFEVEDPTAATRVLAAAGATVLAPPTRTPWGSLNARLAAPGDLQLTLFGDEPAT